MIFKKFKINQVTLKNRIVISPMCQYSAINGCPSKWHYKHLQNLSSTGASMVMLESTAISREGRITPADLCLYNNNHEKNLKKLISFLKSYNDINYGIQISHSGRKGSSNIPWVKYNSPLKKNKSWKTFSASQIARDKGWPIPKEMSIKEIQKLILSFGQASKRANRIGFECLEIHMAHGYLLHQFFSPISNKRKDDYGGNFEKRCKLLIEISKIVRKNWPKNKILGARITGTDHLKNGVTIDESLKLSKKLQNLGFDYISVSSGGIIPKTKMKQYEGFRIKMANEFKKKLKIFVTTSGLLTKFSKVKRIIADKSIDFITIARIIIKKPQWIHLLAKKNNLTNLIPKQYKNIIT